MSDKRTALVIKQPEENKPPLISGYLKLGKNDVAIVLRPNDRKTVLMITVDKVTQVWRSRDEPESEHSEGDAIRAPKTPVELAEAIKELKNLQNVAKTAGEPVLRSTWSGSMEWDGQGLPKLTLVRKVATYAEIKIESTPKGVWKYSVVRTEKWFSSSKNVTGEHRYLHQAMGLALQQIMSVAAEACQVRDTHRRQALDPVYAQQKPSKVAAEKKNPIEKVKEPAPPAEKKPRGRKPKEPAATTAAPASPAAGMPAAGTPAAGAAAGTPAAAAPAAGAAAPTPKPERKKRAPKSAPTLDSATPAMGNVYNFPGASGPVPSMQGPAVPGSAYPPPGYPPQAYPQPGYPPPGYPQPGLSQPGYPQAGYPQPGYPPPANGFPPPAQSGLAPVQMTPEQMASFQQQILASFNTQLNTAIPLN